MGNYNSLVPHAGYLSNVRLTPSHTTGITQDDLDKAEAHAKATIDAELSPVYDVSDWADMTPTMIERLADMLSSEQILETQRQRGIPLTGIYPSVVGADTQALLGMLKRGVLETYLPSGELVKRRKGGKR